MVHHVPGKLLPEVDRFLASCDHDKASRSRHVAMGRRILLPADAHLRTLRDTIRRAYVEAVKRTPR